MNSNTKEIGMFIRLHPDIIFRKTNQSAKIVSFDHDKYFVVNGLISEVIELLQIGCEEAHILQELSHRIPLEKALVPSDISTSIEYLKRWGLIENFPISLVRPNEVHSLLGSIKAVSFNQIHFGAF